MRRRAKNLPKNAKNAKYAKKMRKMRNKYKVIFL